MDNCIEEWVELTNLGMKAEEPDFYDLELPAKETEAIEGTDRTRSVQRHIGSDKSCAVQIDGIEDKHVCVEKNGDKWVATLTQPFDRVLRMTIGDTKYHRGGAGYDTKEWVDVKPGDVIKIGMNHILLHAPEEGESEG